MYKPLLRVTVPAIAAGVLVLAGVTSSAAAPIHREVVPLAAQVKGDAQAHPYGSHAENDYRDSDNEWSSTVTVFDGQSRSITFCNNGTRKVGDWMGRGTWSFYGECYGNGGYGGNHVIEDR
ncbi:hypothetical protein ACFWY9_26180 [Amycolatopsis sp. NPDC059027]|uniref:hypothetical protein n=1 Tax=unclassified Amycolatopsis TaxID=2618356 RepID=UPI00366CE3B3